MKNPNSTYLTVKLSLHPSEAKSIFQRTCGSIYKEALLEDIEKHISRMADEYFKSLAMRADDNFELDHSEIIKPLTLNYEHVGRIKEHFQKTN
jgi:hypothetical protein